MKNTTAFTILSALIGMTFFYWLVGSSLLGIFLGWVFGMAVGPRLLKALNMQEAPEKTEVST